MYEYSPVVLISNETGLLDYDMPRQSFWITQHGQRRKIARGYKLQMQAWQLYYGETSKSFNSIMDCAKWLMQEEAKLIRNQS